MTLGEIIDLIEKSDSTISLDSLANELWISRTSVTRLLRENGIRFKEGDKKWEIDYEKIDENINLFNSFWLSNNPLKPQSNVVWDCEKHCITKEEIINILENIDSFNLAESTKLYEDNKKRIAIYITEYLEHPLDAILVTEAMAKTIKGKKPPLHIVSCINTIGLCIALKNKIKIPINISAAVFQQFRIKSIQNNKHKNDEIKINCYVRAIFAYTENMEIIEKELWELNKFEGRFIGAKKSSNLYYYILICLLNAKSQKKGCKIDWLKLNFVDLDLYTIYEINQYMPVKKFDINSLNFIYYLKFSMKRFFPSKDFNVFLQITIEDEINNCFQLYKLYTLANSRSIEPINKANQLLSHRPQGFTKIHQLTTDNIKSWIDNYIRYTIENENKQETAWRRINYICRFLYDIKEIFEEDNSYGIKIAFPYNKQDIGSDSGKIYRWYSENYELLSGVDNDFGNKTIMEYGLEKVKTIKPAVREGTFKIEIDKADQIVRAIYNYSIKAEAGTIEYFNELQLKTMLMIIADSGVRYSEVINMMYGTLSYIEEEKRYICVLGWSKTFERFGVVPISHETAEMIKRCMEFRSDFYSETLTIEHEIMDGTKSKLKSDSKYVLQFVLLNSSNKENIKSRKVSTYRLTAFFKDLCVEAGVKLENGKLFHLLRHRAAEYFFFCLSFYDVEYKDDYEYKELVVKRLLRHRKTSEMTKKYNWSRLLDILSEGKLVFLRSLPHLSDYSNDDSRIHEESIKKKIQNDLSDVLTSSNIEKITKLLTVPYGLINEELLESISKERSFKIIFEHLEKVDGNKGFVPEGAAYFGRCTNFSCQKLLSKISCISCNSHILEKSDIPMAIGEIVRCYEAINEIYLYRYNEISSNDHIKSLRGRITALLERLNIELEISPMELTGLISNRIESDQMSLKIDD